MSELTTQVSIDGDAVRLDSFNAGSSADPSPLQSGLENTPIPASTRDDITRVHTFPNLLRTASGLSQAGRPTITRQNSNNVLPAISRSGTGTRSLNSANSNSSSVLSKIKAIKVEFPEKFITLTQFFLTIIGLWFAYILGKASNNLSASGNELSLRGFCEDNYDKYKETPACIQVLSKPLSGMKPRAAYVNHFREIQFSKHSTWTINRSLLSCYCFGLVLLVPLIRSQYLRSWMRKRLSRPRLSIQRKDDEELPRPILTRENDFIDGLRLASGVNLRGLQQQYTPLKSRKSRKDSGKWEPEVARRLVSELSHAVQDRNGSRIRQVVSAENAKYATFLVRNRSDIVLAAIEMGDHWLVTYLLDQGAEIDSSKHLFLAIRRGLTELVNVLLKRGAQIGLDVRDDFGRTPLCAAIRDKQEDIIKALLEHGADVKNDEALYDATIGGMHDMMKLLLRHGAPPNAASRDNDHALSVATRRNDMDAARILLAHHADPRYGAPLLEAVLTGKSDMASLLVNKGATVDVSEGYSLQGTLKKSKLWTHGSNLYADMTQVYKTTILKQDNQNLSMRNPYSDFSLTVDDAFPPRSPELEQGSMAPESSAPDVDPRVQLAERHNYNLLCIAVEKDDLEMIMILLKAGAKLNDGRALGLSVQLNRCHVLDIFLQHIADPLSFKMRDFAFRRGQSRPLSTWESRKSRTLYVDFQVPAKTEKQTFYGEKKRAFDKRMANKRRNESVGYHGPPLTKDDLLRDEELFLIEYDGRTYPTYSLQPTGSSVEVFATTTENRAASPDSSYIEARVKQGNLALDRYLSRYILAPGEKATSVNSAHSIVFLMLQRRLWDAASASLTHDCNIRQVEPIVWITWLKGLLESGDTVPDRVLVQLHVEAGELWGVRLLSYAYEMNYLLVVNFLMSKIDLFQISAMTNISHNALKNYWTNLHISCPRSYLRFMVLSAIKAGNVPFVRFLISQMKPLETTGEASRCASCDMYSRTADICYLQEALKRADSVMLGIVLSNRIDINEKFVGFGVRKLTRVTLLDSVLQNMNKWFGVDGKWFRLEGMPADAMARIVILCDHGAAFSEKSLTLLKRRTKMKDDEWIEVLERIIARCYMAKPAASSDRQLSKREESLKVLHAGVTDAKEAARRKKHYVGPVYCETVESDGTNMLVENAIVNTHESEAPRSIVVAEAVEDPHFNGASYVLEDTAYDGVEELFDDSTALVFSGNDAITITAKINEERDSNE